MINEIWKTVPGLGFEVSSLGNVRSNVSRQPDPIVSTGGYLWVNHAGSRYALHRLVCRAFHGEPPVNKRRALHWDDDKTNNAASNLRWGDALDNAADAARNGIVVGPAAWNMDEYRARQAVRDAIHAARRKRERADV